MFSAQTQGRGSAAVLNRIQNSPVPESPADNTATEPGSSSNPAAAQGGGRLSEDEAERIIQEKATQARQNAQQGQQTQQVTPEDHREPVTHPEATAGNANPIDGEKPEEGAIDDAEAAQIKLSEAFEAGPTAWQRLMVDEAVKHDTRASKSVISQAMTKYAKALGVTVDKLTFDQVSDAFGAVVAGKIDVLSGTLKV